MKAAHTEAPARKGDRRFIRIQDRYSLCECVMMLGTVYDTDAGKTFRECVWGEVESGRRIHGSAHERWVA